MSRIVHIDYLRNFANILRCFLHASIPYMMTDSIWPVNDNGSLLFDVTVFEIHLFVMELFFVISGFLFAMEINRSNLSNIIKNRTNRIVIPFILGLIIIVPIVLSLFNFSTYSGVEVFSIDVIKESYLSGWKLGLANFFPTAHLWFLFYLIIFYMLTLVFRKVILKINVKSVFHLVCFGVIISFISMFFMKRWFVDNPLTLVPEIPSLIHYYVFFLIGLFLYNLPDLISSVKYYSRNLLILGLIIGLLSIIPQLYFDQKDLTYYFIIKILAIFSLNLASYFIVLGIWGVCTNLNLKDSKLLRYITDSSYWVYLSNMPIVAFIHILLVPLGIPIFLKFLIAFIGSFSLSMLSYELLVRYTFIGAILNKRRYRRSH